MVLLLAFLLTPAATGDGSAPDSAGQRPPVMVVFTSGDPLAIHDVVALRNAQIPVQATEHPSPLVRGNEVFGFPQDVRDRLPEEVAVAITPLLDAFVGYHSTSLQALGSLSHASLYEARGQLLAATLAFEEWVDGRQWPVVIDASPILLLDLAGQDSAYESSAAFQIDIGGNDVYRNRAGGGGVFINTLCPFAEEDLVNDPGRTIPVGFLADFGGDDAYVSGYDCGTNGGGFQGSGFLYDAEGDDVYESGQGGVNGGGFLGGFGYLHDAGGNDVYAARPEHTTYGYGANGAGSLGGIGTLIDEGGHDAYEAGQEGANGGGYAAGIGTLVDAWGDDHYIAGSLGTNGAGFSGWGWLWDGAGNDTYVSSQPWGNSNGDGEGVAPASGARLACLYDGAGTDWYDDNHGTAGWDLTVHPKSFLGSQYDDEHGTQGDCPATDA